MQSPKRAWFALRELLLGMATGPVSVRWRNPAAGAIIHKPLVPKRLMTRDVSIIALETLVAAGVAEPDAREIISVGLPSGSVGHLECRPQLVEGVLVLAYDSDVPLVVRAGEVRALDAVERLVNTNVEAFCRMVERYDDYRRAVRSEEDADKIAINAAFAMSKIDPRAFADGDSYWPIVCEQMRDGNL